MDIAGVAIPIALALAGWLGYVHRQTASAAAREAVQNVRLSRLERRMDLSEDKLDKLLTLCTETSTKLDMLLSQRDK